MFFDEPWGGDVIFSSGPRNDERIKNIDCISHFWKVVQSLQEGSRHLLSKHSAEYVMKVFGYPCKTSIILVDLDGNPSMRSRTVYLQEAVARGLFIPYIVPSCSHKTEDVKEALTAIEDAILVFIKAHEEKDFDKNICIYSQTCF